MILIVDDEALIRWSLKERLTEAGYEVSEAEGGQAALDLFSRNGLAIRLVFLDYKLPDVDGLTVLEGIKDKRPDCKVIMMSAHGTEAVMNKAKKLGVERFISKPFDYEEIVKAAGEMLN